MTFVAARDGSAFAEDGANDNENLEFWTRVNTFTIISVHFIFIFRVTR